MNSPKLDTSFGIKRPQSRYIMIDENIHAALSLYALSLYIAFRYEADFLLEDAVIRRSAQFMYTKAKISRPHYYRCLNELESLGLILRDESNKLGDKCVFHIARELGYFTRGIHVVDRGVSVRDRGVSVRDTDHYSIPIIKDITNSESCDSPVAAIKDKPQKPSSGELLRLLIDCYRREFPDNPQPHARVISTSLQKTLQTLIKRWPELDPNGNPLTPELFGRYLHLLRTTAPKFSLSEYVTESGNRKKNGLETFARWNTVVKFMENQYS